MPALQFATSLAPDPIIEECESKWEPIPCALSPLDTSPSRGIAEHLRSIKPNPFLEPLNLFSGNPTLPPPKEALDAFYKAMNNPKSHGYAAPTGLLAAREAIAGQTNTYSAAPVTSNDVIITAGVSSALEILVKVLAKPGENILVPNPGYPLYEGIMRTEQVQARPYEIEMNKYGSSLNFSSLEAAIDSKTKAIFVNNPTNPQGIVFSRKDMRKLLEIATKHRIPIVSDEIYGWITFSSKSRFHSLASEKPQAPLITLNGISKRYLLAGWRIGWIVLHDYNSAFLHIRGPLKSLASRLNGTCTLAQAALPDILTNVPAQFHEALTETLKQNVEMATETLAGVPGLEIVKPSGGFYLVVKIQRKCFPKFGSDVEFAEALISEKSLMCCPGSMFYASVDENSVCSSKKWFLRIVLAHSPSVIANACDRLSSFCWLHSAVFVKTVKLC